MQEREKDQDVASFKLSLKPTKTPQASIVSRITVESFDRTSFASPRMTGLLELSNGSDYHAPQCRL